MSKKIVELVPLAPPAPDQDIINICKRLLEQAERGEIKAVGIAMERSDGLPALSMAYANGTNVCTLYWAAMTLAKRVDALSED